MWTVTVNPAAFDSESKTLVVTTASTDSGMVELRFNLEDSSLYIAEFDLEPAMARLVAALLNRSADDAKKRARG